MGHWQPLELGTAGPDSLERGQQRHTYLGRKKELCREGGREAAAAKRGFLTLGIWKDFREEQMAGELHKRRRSTSPALDVAGGASGRSVVIYGDERTAGY